MLQKLQAFMPTKLKYRLFTAFLLLILLPFSILNIYNYQRIESLVQGEISEQSHEQLQSLLRSLEDQMSIATKTLMFLEQDSAVREVLQYPGLREPIVNTRLVEDRFQDINNSFFLYNPFVYFTLIDFHGNVYTSYNPALRLNYDNYINNPAFQQMLERQANLWVPNDVNDLNRDISSSSSLLSLYAKLKDQRNEVYALARVSIDYTYWFQVTLRNSDSDQEYFILTSDGSQLASSKPDSAIEASVVEEITASPQGRYVEHESTSSLFNYSYIDSLDWYLVNRIPTDELFQELNTLKRNYFATFIVLTLAFIGLAFLISHTFTRPLSYLKTKMGEAVQKGLRVRLPERRFKGEVLALTQTYNTMLDDMNKLIQQLKKEERQKEAVQFQMLLAQLNPHFLLNTLNTMKWIALRNQNEDIAEMCLALGKLLEASLNSEVDLIHLQNEIDLTEAYVYIQQYRYKDSFRVEYAIDEGLEYAIVPKLGLQPLVENAIQHGFGNLQEQGVIHIRAFEADAGTLCIEVSDNGIGIEAAKKQAKPRKRAGIGLANIRDRLRLLYKDQGRLEIVPLERGTMIRLTLPLLLSPPYDRNQNLMIDSGGMQHVESASG